MFIIALSLASVKELDLPHSGTPNAICFNNISVLLLQDMYKVWNLCKLWHKYE